MADYQADTHGVVVPMWMTEIHAGLFTNPVDRVRKTKAPYNGPDVTVDASVGSPMSPYKLNVRIRPKKDT
jgi:hypothetical protein